MNFSTTPEFDKDVKALAKRVRTIRSDIERVKPRVAILYEPVEDVDLNEYRQLFFASKKATIISSSNDIEIIKMRLDTDIDSARNKLRLVFVAVRNAENVTFLEVYSKSDKDREDSRRIKSYTKNAPPGTTPIPTSPPQTFHSRYETN